MVLLIDKSVCFVAIFYSFDMVQLPGKRSRRVPLLITIEAKAAMDALVRLRDKVGIPSGNPYFFASDSVAGHIDGGHVLKSIAIAAGTELPQRISSTNLRKYCATVTQVIFRSNNCRCVLLYV